MRYFHFNHRNVTPGAQLRIHLRIFESSELHCGQSPWHPPTPPPPRPLLRNPTRLLLCLWPHIGIPEPPASSRTFHSSLKGVWIREAFLKIFLGWLLFSFSFFFLKSPLLCWAHLFRDWSIHDLSSHIRPTETLRLAEPRRCILAQRCWRWSSSGTCCCLSPRLRTVRKPDVAML